MLFLCPLIFELSVPGVKNQKKKNLKKSIFINNNTYADDIIKDGESLIGIT